MEQKQNRERNGTGRKERVNAVQPVLVQKKQANGTNLFYRTPNKTYQF